MHFQRLACSILLFSVILMSPLSFTLAYDLLDPNGSINIKWDITSWKSDGYLATVTISNLQMYRPIPSPGWTLGWTWAKKEVIWSMVGAQAIDQGDCSDFKTNIPHSCERSPAIIDLLPGRVPENQQFPGCCKGGVLGSHGLDEAAAFQVNVGHSGTSRKTVRVPRRFYLLGPGASYTCGSAMVVPSSVFLSDDGRRRTRAMMTWTVTCTYSPMLVSKNPNCCVSLSSFYNPMITPCSTCACGCKHKHNCIESRRGSEISTQLKPNLVINGDAQPLQCTQHMCPIQVHWHFKVNYKKYWRVKITVTNLNYWIDYSHWNLVLQHPNLNNVVRVYNFTYKPLLYHSMNGTGVFYGVEDGNEVLMGARNGGNVHSEMILGKDEKEFTLDGGWVFPRKVYFNGDECLMPPPDSYPFLPKSPSLIQPSLFAGALLLILLAFCSFWCGSKIKTHKTKRKTPLLSKTNL